MRHRRPLFALAVATALLPGVLAAPKVLAACTAPPSDTVKSVGSPSLVGNTCVPVSVLPIIPNPHVEACSTTLDDQIWVVSGSINSWSNNGRPMMPTGRTDIFSASDDQWYAGPAVNIPRINYPNVFNVHGTLFLVGGFEETAPDSGQFTPCHRVEVCRPDGKGFQGLGTSITAGDKAWHLLPSAYDMPAGTRNIWNRSNAVVGDTLYLFTPGQTLAFNTASGVWRTNLATRAGANGNFSCATALNDLIYVSGGSGGSSPTYPEAALFAVYDPATDAWRDLPRFPDPGLAEHTMEIVGDGKLLVIGGDFNGTALYYYDPATNQLVQREAKPPVGQPANLYARSDHLTGVYKGYVYVVGGIVAGSRTVQPSTLAIGLPAQ